MLFTGFMLTQSGPKVLEYNVRFGDPETEALMLLLADDVDFAALLLVRACKKKLRHGYLSHTYTRLVLNTVWTRFQ